MTFKRGWIENNWSEPIKMRKAFEEENISLLSVELLVNKPLLNVAGYTQCRTNEGCTYVHCRIYSNRCSHIAVQVGTEYGTQCGTEYAWNMQ